MRNKLNNNLIERYSRQIVLKNIGVIGQKKIINAKVLVVGAGGLGCPVAECLARAGVGKIGVVDNDKISLSNIHRQTIYETRDVGKYKVDVVKNRLKKINHYSKVEIFKNRLKINNAEKLIRKFDIIVDGSDNFSTKLLLNEKCKKYQKQLIVGAISKFDGHIFTFDFKNKKTPCLKCFYQTVPSDEILNCEAEGVIGSVAGIIGNIQANEVLKKITKIGNDLSGKILIINLLSLNFRKISFSKKKNCLCGI
tara:strand:+ start:450 stop:1205 length:756 start_codon:yes stop_codon:yes gene_type:complete